MRKWLALAGLVAIIAVPLAGTAAAGEKVGDEPVCKTAFVPADVGLDVAVEKKITLGGTVLKADVNQEVVEVFKTIAVEVCLRTEGDVIADADLDGALDGISECPEGRHGVDIKAPVTLKAGAEGGAITASVTVAVHDEDAVLGVVESTTDVVIKEEQRLDVPPATVEGTDAVNANVCVGAAVG